MNKYIELTDIIGVRILQQNKHTSEQYHIIHVFIGDNWKESARSFVEMYIDKPDIAFHTFHRFKSSAGLPEPYSNHTFWIYAPHFSLNVLT